MMRRILLAPLLVAACEAAPPSPSASPSPASIVRPARTPEVAVPDDRIACALPGASAFARLCSLEERGDLVIVRQPDGGFHRLRRVDDARGLVAADGSEEPNVADLDDGSIEVAIGGARYRLPAR